MKLKKIIKPKTIIEWGIENWAFVKNRGIKHKQNKIFLENTKYQIVIHKGIEPNKPNIWINLVMLSQVAPSQIAADPIKKLISLELLIFEIVWYVKLALVEVVNVFLIKSSVCNLMIKMLKAIVEIMYLSLISPNPCLKISKIIKKEYINIVKFPVLEKEKKRLKNENIKSKLFSKRLFLSIKEWSFWKKTGINLNFLANLEFEIE